MYFFNFWCISASNLWTNCSKFLLFLFGLVTFDNRSYYLSSLFVILNNFSLRVLILLLFSAESIHILRWPLFWVFLLGKKKSYWGFWLSRLGRRCSTRQAAHLLFRLAFSLFSQRLLRSGPSSWFCIPRPVRWVINPSRDPSRHHHYISAFWWWFHCIIDHVTIQLPHRLTSWNVCVIIQPVLIKCSYVFNHCLYFFLFFFD